MKHKLKERVQFILINVPTNYDTVFEVGCFSKSLKFHCMKGSEKNNPQKIHADDGWASQDL